MRIAISALALALLSFLAARPADAEVGPAAIGWLGYGNVFQDGDDVALGPTLEIGGSFGFVLGTVDLTYWTDLDDPGSSSQLRLGGRLAPPVIPLYGRLAFGFPLDGDVQDAQGGDLVIGAGFDLFSLPLLTFNIEVDYHYWTDGLDIHPFEAKLGVIVGF